MGCCMVKWCIILSVSMIGSLVNLQGCEMCNVGVDGLFDLVRTGLSNEESSTVQEDVLYRNYI